MLRIRVRGKNKEIATRKKQFNPKIAKRFHCRWLLQKSLLESGAKTGGIAQVHTEEEDVDIISTQRSSQEEVRN